MPGSRPDPQPVLSDGVLLLRPPRPTDIDDIAEACVDPEIAAWTTVPSPYTRADAEGFLEHRPADWRSNPLWAVTRVPSDRWSGGIDLRPDGAGGAEMGYLLAPWARGHGHAARMIRLVCAYGFAELGLSVIWLHIYVGNDASRRAARSAGFRIHDVVLRQHLVHRGERRDAWVGDLLPDDLTQSARGAGVVRGPAPLLTRREREVLDELARGARNRDIAVALGISENTVKNHIRSVLDKLQVRSRSEAVVVALRLGLTSLAP
jgi:RimJ/RimL family protein N-acetyltransferase/DNA-binding CsgD family transcriptional regulator